jgi:hypothetical protein
MSALFFGAASMMSGSAYTVTVATSVNDVGFIDGAVGSISPTTYNGVDVKAIYYSVGEFAITSFRVRLLGTIAQNFFTSVSTPNINSNAELTSSSATYSVSGGQSSWVWSLVSAGGSWTAGSGTEIVTFK